MMKRQISLILGICVICLCIAACDNNIDILKPNINLLEYPGLKWGMTPETAKIALNITDDMIAKEETIEDEFRLTLSGAEYFGVDAESVILRFLQYNNKTALWNVQVTYPAGTDMTTVRDHLINIYGPGTDYGFTDYEIHNGTVQSYIDWNTLPIDSTLDSIQFGTSIEDNAKHPNPPDILNHRWASTAKGSDVISNEDLETIVQAFDNGVGTNADRETVIEYLDKKVLATLVCRDGYTNKYGIEYRPCISFTGRHIAFIKLAVEDMNS